MQKQACLNTNYNPQVVLVVLFSVATVVSCHKFIVLKPHKVTLLYFSRLKTICNGNPLQYSCLENPMDRGAWWAAVHGVARSRTRLSDFTFTFHFHALAKEMATNSSVLAWRIPGTGEPGGLLSLGSHRVGHDWSDLAAAAAAEGITRLKPYGQQSCIPFWGHWRLPCFLAFFSF